MIIDTPVTICFVIPQNQTIRRGPTYVITIHQRHTRHDGQTERRTNIRWYHPYMLCMHSAGKN